MSHERYLLLISVTFLGGVIWTFSVFLLTSRRCSDKQDCFLQSPCHCSCFQGEFRARFKSDWSEQKDKLKSSLFTIKKYFQYNHRACEEVKGSTFLLTGPRKGSVRGPGLLQEMSRESGSEEPWHNNPWYSPNPRFTRCKYVLMEFWKSLVCIWGKGGSMWFITC